MRVYTVPDISNQLTFLTANCRRKKPAVRLLHLEPRQHRALRVADERHLQAPQQLLLLHRRQGRGRAQGTCFGFETSF
jgi:hypothetical protein